MSRTAPSITAGAGLSEDGPHAPDGDDQQRRKLSVVVCVFNEEENLPEFHRRIQGVIGSLPGQEVEVIFVDDGSRDGSLAVLRRVHAEDPRCKILRLSRNFGSWNALAAGVRAASGDAVAWISSDLQDPPEVIPEMVRRWEEGADVVWAARMARRDPWSRRIAASVFYRLIRRLALPQYPIMGMDLCLMDRRVVRIFRHMREHNRFTQAMVMALGFTQVMVPYTRESRRRGMSTWGRLHRLVKIGIDMIVGVSFLPLRWSAYVGLAIGLLAAVLAAAGLIRGLTGAGAIEGWHLAVWTMLAVGSLNLIALGVLGEYLWRVLENVRGRPLYVVQERIGFDPAPGGARLSPDRAAVVPY